MWWLRNSLHERCRGTSGNFPNCFSASCLRKLHTKILGQNPGSAASQAEHASAGDQKCWIVQQGQPPSHRAPKAAHLRCFTAPERILSLPFHFVHHPLFLSASTRPSKARSISQIYLYSLFAHVAAKPHASNAMPISHLDSSFSNVHRSHFVSPASFRGAHLVHYWIFLRASLSHSLTRSSSIQFL